MLGSGPQGSVGSLHLVMWVMAVPWGEGRGGVEAVAGNIGGLSPVPRSYMPGHSHWAARILVRYT